MATEFEIEGVRDTATLAENFAVSNVPNDPEVSVVVNPDYGRWAADNNVGVKPDIPVSEMGEGMQQQLSGVMNPANGSIVTAVPPEHHIEVAGDALAATPAPKEDGLGFGLLDRAVDDVKQVVAGLQPEEAAPTPALAPAPVAPAPNPMG